MTEIDQQRVVWPPEPGFFTMKLVKGGPLVPARIVHEAIRDPITGQLLDRSWVWSAFINGALVGEPHRNPSLAPGVAKIWTFGTKITAEQYQAMVLRKDAVIRSGSGLPESNPRKKINLSKMKPVI